MKRFVIVLCAVLLVGVSGFAEVWENHTDMDLLSGVKVLDDLYVVTGLVSIEPEDNVKNDLLQSTGDVVAYNQTGDVLWKYDYGQGKPGKVCDILGFFPDGNILMMEYDYRDSPTNLWEQDLGYFLLSIEGERKAIPDKVKNINQAKQVWSSENGLVFYIPGHDADSSTLTCYDKNLDFQWEIKMAAYSNMWLNQVIMDDAKNAYCAGFIEEKKGSSAALLKLDAQGEAVWMYQHPEQSCYYDVILDENYLYTGGYEAGTESGAPRDALLCKQDSNGNVIWKQSYSDLEWGSIYSLEAYGGEIVLLGKEKGNQVAGISPFYFSKMDQDGMLLANESIYVDTEYSQRPILSHSFDGKAVLFLDNKL